MSGDRVLGVMRSRGCSLRKGTPAPLLLSAIPAPREKTAVHEPGGDHAWPWTHPALTSASRMLFMSRPVCWIPSWYPAQTRLECHKPFCTQEWAPGRRGARRGRRQDPGHPSVPERRRQDPGRPNVPERRRRDLGHPSVPERRRVCTGGWGRAAPRGSHRPHLGPLSLCTPSETQDRQQPTEWREASEPTQHAAGEACPGWVASLSLSFSPAATRRQVRTASDPSPCRQPEKETCSDASAPVKGRVLLPYALNVSKLKKPGLWETTGVNLAGGKATSWDVWARAFTLRQRHTLSPLALNLRAHTVAEAWVRISSLLSVVPTLC